MMVDVKSANLAAREPGERDGGGERGRDKDKDRIRSPRREGPPEKGMERYRIEVGHKHEVMPGNIVGAIANEAGIDSKHIGRISIYDDHSTIDLPGDMPEEIFNGLKKVWVSGQALKISRTAKEENSTKSDRPAINKPEADTPSKRKPKSKIKTKPNAKAKARLKEAANDKKNAKKGIKKVRKKSPE